MYTLQEVKDSYYIELSMGLVKHGLESYIKANYVRTYDTSLHLIGYDRETFGVN